MGKARLEASGDGVNAFLHSAISGPGHSSSRLGGRTAAMQHDAAKHMNRQA
jgi:hypothetical protein